MKKRLICFLFFTLCIAASCFGSTGFYAAAKGAQTLSEEDNDPLAYREYIKQKTGKDPLASTYGTGALSGVTHDQKFQDYTIIQGLDVSKYQPNTNWEKVKADGYDFTIIRVGYRGYSDGTLNQDIDYVTNVTNALAAGMDVGVYIYSQAITEKEAREEADYAINLVKDYAINLPIVMDFEYAANSKGKTGRLYKANLTKEKATKIMRAFCEQAESRGYTGMVYASKSLLVDDVNPTDVDAEYPIWVAQYYDRCTYTGAYDYWQYTSTGKVNGVKGSVDLDFRYIKEPDTPDNFKLARKGTSGHILSWSKVPGVYGYVVYQYDIEKQSYKKLATLKGASNTTYINTDIKKDVPHYYAVRAFYKLADKNWYSDYTKYASLTTPSILPGNLRAHARSNNAIYLEWDTDSSVCAHKLMRSTDGLTYRTLAILPEGTSHFTDSALTPGTEYTYRLSLAVSDGDGGMEYFDPEELSCMTPVNNTGVCTVTDYQKNSVTLKWKADKKSAGYRIYKYDFATEQYKLIYKGTDAALNTYQITGLKTNRAYRFLFVTLLKGKTTTYESQPQILDTATLASAPSNFCVTSNSSKQIKLAWDSTEEASGYELYMKQDGSRFLLATLKGSKSAYTIKNLEPATDFHFELRSFRQVGTVKYYSESRTLSCATCPEKLTGLKAKAKKTSITLTWKEAAGATSYLICSYDKKAKRYVPFDAADGLSYTVTKLKRNTKYKFKVIPCYNFEDTDYTGTGLKIAKKTTK